MENRSRKVNQVAFHCEDGSYLRAVVDEKQEYYFRGFCCDKFFLPKARQFSDVVVNPRGAPLCLQKDAATGIFLVTQPSLMLNEAPQLWLDQYDLQVFLRESWRKFEKKTNFFVSEVGED